MSFPKPHKYGAQKSTVDGIHFASKLEAAVYGVLKLREKAGELTDINVIATVILKEKCPTCGDGPLVFKVDFSATVISTGKTLYIEAKGVRVPSYIKREKRWRIDGPGHLEVWVGSWKHPRLKETIIPKKSG